MRSAALPHRETVADLIVAYKMYDFELDTARPHYLERGMTYIIPLLESLALPSGEALPLKCPLNFFPVVGQSAYFGDVSQ